MSYELVAYEILKSSIKEAIASSIKEHKKTYKKDLDKLWEATDILPQERKIQARLLLKTIELLDKQDDKSEAARVLNTLAFYIYDKIVESYGGIYSFVLSADNSGMKRFLGLSLNLTKDNMPGDIELVDMYPSLLNFFLNHVYVGGDCRKGYLPVNPFDIEGYKVEIDIKDLKLKEAALFNNNVDSAEAKKEQTVSPAKHRSTLYGASSSKASVPKTPAKDTTPSAEPVPMSNGLG
ncbi:Dot/Icm T4SS effector [Legionella moravica]|uniref:Dot/Icm T4SS effector n=1 Tax=Legionella moravica TaxID=39962 RepID=A0A378JWJ7_9GAMM|nr:hypothetical protein [Legionella moravica]KTD32290.1 Dot/Icm T4SS effector [Legionella moravica]STX62387.1 Dot/Icm T4SS effector [Legionella moravica]